MLNYLLDMIKVTYESKLDLTRTIISNTKQWKHDHAGAIVTKIDRFFETQAGTIDK